MTPITTNPDLTDVTQPKRPLTLGETPAARVIRAIVDRQPLGPLDGVPQGMAPKAYITVKNHPTEGISTAEAIITTAEPFDLVLIDTAEAFLDSLGAESLIYHPYSGKLDTGKDEIEIALREGGTPERRRITDIISQDKGMLTLEVR